MFDCSNAVFTNVPECERCARVVTSIENFRRKSLDDLKTAIDKENSSFVSQPPSAARATSTPTPKLGPTTRPTSSKATGGPPSRPVETVEQNVTPKIVRIPDDVPKSSDREIAKKRAQTPGRVRASQSQNV